MDSWTELGAAGCNCLVDLIGWDGDGTRDDPLHTRWHIAVRIKEKSHSSNETRK